MLHTRCLRRFLGLPILPLLRLPRLVPFLLDPAAALGHRAPSRMKLQCMARGVVACLSSAVCTSLPPTASMLPSCLTLGPSLLPMCAVCARNVFSPRVRILGLLLVPTQTENTGGATSNTCCLHARVFRAREARWRLHSSGMTSLRRVLGLIKRRRCCLQHFLLIVPLLWLPRLVSYCSSSTLLLPWDVPPLGA